MKIRKHKQKIVTYGFGILISLLVLLCMSKTSSTIRVIVDASIEHQTIDGFGGSEQHLFPQTDNDFNLLFDDLGASILRFRLITQPEDSVRDAKKGDPAYNDNDNPNVIDWSGVDTSWIDYLAGHLPVRAKEKGVNLFFGVPWSPPSWMKENGTLSYSGGKLKPKYYEEFAEYLVIWYLGLRDRNGVTLTHISLQNEPDGGYNQSWDGCTYNGQELRELIKVVGHRFQNEGIEVKIIVPESVKIRTNLADPILQDQAARQFVGVLAVHEYGGSFSEPDGQISNWMDMSDLANQYNLKLWQSEHGNNKATWKEGFIFAQFIHNALYYGNASAWLYHELYQPTRFNGGKGGLITENGPWPKFYWLKNYFKYIRPGAIRVKADSDDNNLLTTAFKHSQDNTFTMVVINRHIYDRTISFDINNIPGLYSLDVIRTSATENAVSLGKISVIGNSFTYTLPRESIATFTGELKKTKKGKIRR